MRFYRAGAAPASGGGGRPGTRAAGDFRALAELLPQVVWTSDAAGSVDFVSRRWEDLTGLPPGRALGRGWLEAVHPEDRARAAESFRVRRAGPGRAEDEFRLASAEGGYRWVLASAAPIPGRAGLPAGWLGTLTDVHAARAAQRALLGREVVYRRLFESGACAVGSGPLDGPARVANAAYLDLLGYTEEDLRAGRLVREALVAPESRPAAERAFAELRARGRAVLDGVELLRQDGSRIWALVSLALAGPDRDQVVWLIIDQTERRRNERLQQRMLGIVSHELGEPLLMLRLAADLIAAPDLPGPRRQRVATNLLRLADRMERIVSDLVDLTRAQVYGGLAVHRSPGDLAAICRDYVADAGAAHPGRRIELACGADGAGSWDRPRVEQLLQNLVGNALRYGDPAAPVRVGLAEAPAPGPGPADLLLEVHNLGAPIPREVLARRFEPFAQAAPARPGGPRSLGLGLYIVNQIARAFGGGVEVSSAPVEGTRVRVRLPRQAPGERR